MRPSGRSRLPAVWVAIALVVGGGYLAGLNEWKFIHSMAAGFYDYGLIQSMVANTAAGDPVPMRPADRAVSHLGTHFTPLLFLLSAARWVLPFQHLTGYVMAMAWYAAVLVFACWAGRATGDPWLGMMAGIAFFFNVFMRRVFYSGHYEQLEIFFELLAVWAYTEKRWRTFVFAVALTCLVREDAALYAAIVCAGLWFVRSDRTGRRVLIGAGAGALVYFVLVWSWAMPHFHTAGPSNPSVMLEDRWGSGSLMGVVARTVRKPVRFIHALVNHRTFRLVAGFGFFPLLVPKFFVVGCVPLVALLSLSQQPDYAQFRYYNAALFLGPLAAAAVMGLARARGRLPASPWQRPIIVALLLLGLAVGSRERINPNLQRDLWGFGLSPGGAPFPVTDRERMLSRALREYPYAGRSVAASFRVFPQVPSRPNVWYLTRWRDVHPDLILVDPALDGETIRFELGLPSLDPLYRAFRQAGYRRLSPLVGCEVFDRSGAR